MTMQKVDDLKFSKPVSETKEYDIPQLERFLEQLTDQIKELAKDLKDAKSIGCKVKFADAALETLCCIELK